MTVLLFSGKIIYLSKSQFHPCKIDRLDNWQSNQFSHSVRSNSLRPHGLQYAKLPCPSPNPRACSNSCPSSVIPFSSCFQSFPASGSFPMSQFFASGGQSIGVSVSASVLPMNTQDWLPLGWTGLISLQSKGLSRVFSNTTVQKHQVSTEFVSKSRIFVVQPFQSKGPVFSQM